MSNIKAIVPLTVSDKDYTVALCFDNIEFIPYAIFLSYSLHAFATNPSKIMQLMKSFQMESNQMSNADQFNQISNVDQFLKCMNNFIEFEDICYLEDYIQEPIKESSIREANDLIKSYAKAYYTNNVNDFALKENYISYARPYNYALGEKFIFEDMRCNDLSYFIFSQIFSSFIEVRSQLDIKIYEFKKTKKFHSIRIDTYSDTTKETFKLYIKNTQKLLYFTESMPIREEQVVKETLESSSYIQESTSISIVDSGFHCDCRKPAYNNDCIRSGRDYVNENACKEQAKRKLLVKSKVIADGFNIAAIFPKLDAINPDIIKLLRKNSSYYSCAICKWISPCNKKTAKKSRVCSHCYFVNGTLPISILSKNCSLCQILITTTMEKYFCQKNHIYCESCRTLVYNHLDDTSYCFLCRSDTEFMHSSEVHKFCTCKIIKTNPMVNILKCLNCHLDISEIRSSYMDLVKLKLVIDISCVYCEKADKKAVFYPFRCSHFGFCIECAIVLYNKFLLKCCPVYTPGQCRAKRSRAFKYILNK